MSKETREAELRAAIGELVKDEIVDVAVCHPRGYTRAQGAAGLIGGGLGSASGFASTSMLLGTALGGRLFASLKEMPPRIGLAVTADAIYAIGMDLRGFDNLFPMVKFDRAATRVDLSSHGMVKYLTITDTEHDVSLELEAKLVNNYDVKALAQLLQLSVVDGGAED